MTLTLAIALGMTLGYGGEFAVDRILAAFDGRGQDQAGDGIAIRQQGLDKGLKIGHAGGGDLEQEVVAAGEVVAFAHFFEGLHVFKQAVIVMSAAATHADEGHDFEAERFAINVDGVAVENADFFHLFEAFGGCGGREADTAT